jgi:hypothetical protein
MTPRKPQTRHRSRNSQSHLSQPIQPSDYESETPFTTPPTRTNTDLNLSVLRRYNPSIHTILSIAASAVIYNFIPPDDENPAGTWDRAEIEGTMFVCTTLENGKEGCCVVVLNKKALDNLIVDLKGVKEVEMTDEFLILRWFDGEARRDKVVGVYIHPDKEDTREVNCEMIKERWEALRDEELGNSDGVVFEESDGQFVGRNLDVNQLFAGGFRRSED